MKHPAKFNDKLIPVFRELLGVAPGPLNRSYVLDPFAGTGKVHMLENGWITRGIEIEKEWADMHDMTRHGDSTNMHWLNDATFDAIVSSPAHGSRHADAYIGPSDRKAHNYAHVLGRPLSKNSGAALHWFNDARGDAYRDLHIKVWKESIRVLKPGGKFIISVKDFYKDKVRQRICQWHFRTLCGLGLSPIKLRRVALPGNGFGANGKSRVPFTYVYCFQK